MLSLLWPFLIYWLILFVVCYIVTEYGHSYLYDEVPARAWLGVLVGSLILAALLTWTRSSYDMMFTEEIGKTVIQAIVWFAVFTLILRFQPQHGAALGILTMIVVAGVATIGVDSLTKSNPVAVQQANLRNKKPVRQALGAPLAPAAKTEPPAK